MIKIYLSLVKPGIIMGNALTAAGGFALASKGHFDWRLFWAMLLGQSLIIACGCACNNYIDKEADQKMARTQNRALPKGAVTPGKALCIAVVLGALGIGVLGGMTNLLALWVALIGFVVYVFFYSFMKYRSHFATLVGSIAGAVPPVIGYAAACGRIDLQALLLFAVIACWQMPHFYAIAIYRMEDYAKASIPVLPIEKGMQATKVQMLLYILAFAAASSFLALFGDAGKGYLGLSLLLSLLWAVLCLQGFKGKSDLLWAKQMFRFSLVVVTGISAALLF
jgi:protoheme IX farnesyltransferase